MLKLGGGKLGGWVYAYNYILLLGSQYTPNSVVFSGGQLFPSVGPLGQLAIWDI